MTHEEAIQTQEEVRPLLTSYLFKEEHKFEIGKYEYNPKGEDTPEYYLHIIFPTKFIPGEILRRLAAYCNENGRSISIAAVYDLYISIS